MAEKDKSKESKSGSRNIPIEKLFCLVEHNHQYPPRNELNIVSLISNGIFKKRIIGFDKLIAYRKKNPDDAFVLVSNHLSEADFIETMRHFMSKRERLLIQGGDNLFIDNFELKTESINLKLNLNTYLRSRGAFQIIRKPKTVQFNGETIELNQKDVLRLNRAYLFHLVEQGEFFLQYPGQSVVDDKPKQGRTYTGKIDSFSRAIFQLLIEAAITTKKEIHIVPMNISYETVIEDTQFQVLLKMKAEEASDRDLYMADMGYIINEYLNPERKARLCIKFGKPEPMKLQHFWTKLGLGKKGTATKMAAQFYDRVMSLQTPFPPNVLFTAMKGHKRLDIKYLEEKISLLMELLDLRGADMHYLKTKKALKSPAVIIDEAFATFGKRNIISRVNGKIEILRPDVAEQYVNHIEYLLAKKPD